ncbi:hypothetical protein GCM10011611_02870 [Aliidongia dinghuensis]|uniref:PEP-CTERM sorting domain-containing protein n=1 Tax=Aliidongia dinghuensis TaxID=1867774 RepID=A0A8J3E1C6_9PROT|nr:hypothetical protein [Aliidongia dinghuensis]GGF00707.1 hypothetical protein GCM10011611_02870 [Aliidongia dinghuensis]
MRRVPAALFALLIAAVGSAKAEVIAWDYTGIVQYSNASSIHDGMSVSGQVTYDTSSPGYTYNAGASAQYDTAVSAISVSVPQASVLYSLASGPGSFQIQDNAFGNYEAVLYANAGRGATFSGSGLPLGVSGIELFLNSLTDFLTPDGGTNLPTAPYSLSSIPYTWDQNGQGAWVEFYPGTDGSGYVRAEITNLTEDISLPEPGSLATLAVGLAILGIAWERRSTTGRATAQS